MNPKLVVIGGEVKTEEVNLILPTVIGRGRNVTLTLPQPLVSRRHCEIYQKNGKLFVRDLGSLNGTFVDNVRIEKEYSLEPGQLLTVGSVTFRAVYEPVSLSRETQYDPQALRETVGSSSDTDELQIESLLREAGEKTPTEAAPADISKPRSNPRPHSPDVPETMTLNASDLTAQDIAEVDRFHRSLEADAAAGERVNDHDPSSSVREV